MDLQCFIFNWLIKNYKIFHKKSILLLLCFTKKILQGRMEEWRLLQTACFSPGQTELKVEFPIPCVANNLMVHSTYCYLWNIIFIIML
jgi:hypothetical protein